MSEPNSAAWIHSQGARLEVGPVERYKPGKGQVLVETRAWAINPVDCGMQDTGMLIQKYPAVFGCDTAGVVAEVGEGVTHVTVGSRVLAQMNCMEGQPRCAFQRFAIAPEILTVPIPDDLSFTDASVIPLAYLTAAAGLYMKGQLELPWPQLNPQSSGKTLLIWGGATSVGCLAIQLAVASGLSVITTSSPKNFELLKSLGATKVFDYNGDSAVADVTAALQGSDFLGVYEASGMDDAMKKSIEILSSLGGGYMAATRWPPKELPANVRSEWIVAGDHPVKDEGSARYVWQEFLPAALKSGQFKSAPRAEIVGKGLEGIQDGLDAWKKGVSATKIVIDT